MGTSVFFGMLVATFMGVFIIPGNYTFIEGVGRRKKAKVAEPPAIAVEPDGQHGPAPPVAVSVGGGH